MRLFNGLFAFILFTSVSMAQSALSSITDIFQSKCTGCHSGTSASGNLDLSGNEADIYDALYRVNPNNLAARSEGMKLIMPGYPSRSFLFKKIHNSLEPYFELNANQGNPCPQNSTHLSNEEIELVRQWILEGAPDTGTVLNQPLIHEYYAEGGLSRIEAPEIPPPGQGLQIHYGPFFIGKGQETEIFKKHDLALPNDVEVYRIDVRMNWQSHHFILWKFDENNLVNFFPDGTRDLYSFPNVLNAKTVFGWQYTDDVILPEGSAYFWTRNTVLDLDYHIKNYSTDSILAAEVYINVYYYPKGTVQREMIAAGEIFNMDSFCVPADNKEHFYSDAIYDSSKVDEEWDIWMLSSHTHKYGLDFDIFLRNEDGTKGEKVYEGFYNTDYSFNQGFYDYAHPAIRKITPTIRVKASEGLIYEALFKNYGNQTACFGPTTDDEMLVAYYQYTIADQASSSSSPALEQLSGFAVFPNPFSTSGTVQFELSKYSSVELEIFNSLGAKTAMVASGNFPQGKYSYPIGILSEGIYTVRLTVNGQPQNKTLVSVR